MLAIPPSHLKSAIEAYKRRVRTGSQALDEEERRSADRLLGRIELIDWYSMSNFWSHFAPAKGNSCWRTVRSQTMLPYLKAAVHTLLNPASDCFLQFMAEIELRLRFYILQSDVGELSRHQSRMAASCPFFPSLQPELLASLGSCDAQGFHQRMESSSDKVAKSAWGSLSAAQDGCAMAAQAYASLRREYCSRRRRKAVAGTGAGPQPRTSDEESEEEGDKSVAMDDEEEDSDELESQLDAPLPPEALALKAKWDGFCEALLDKIERLRLLRSSFRMEGKASARFWGFADDWGRRAREYLRGHGAAEEDLERESGRERGGVAPGAGHRNRRRADRKRKGAAASKGEKTAEKVTLEALEGCCSTALRSLEQLGRQLEGGLASPLYSTLVRLCDGYGVTDSTAKIREIYQLDGKAKCAVGGQFEDKVVLHHLPALCDIIAASYSELKGVDSTTAGAWLRYCLCPEEGQGIPPCDLPRLIFSTGTKMRSWFELEGPLPPPSSSPQELGSRPSSTSPSTAGAELALSGENDNEDTPAQDILFVFEVKNNCADIEKAGRQRDKLFKFLDTAWKVRNNELLQLEATTFSPRTNCKTVCPLSQRNFLAYFSNPVQRYAQFIMVTTMPDTDLPAGAPPSYAEEISLHLIDDIYKCLDGKKKWTPLLKSIAETAFSSAGCSSPSPPYPTLPLIFELEDPTREQDAPATAADPIQQAMHYKKSQLREILPERPLRLPYPLPDYNIRLHRCPGDTNFIAVTNAPHSVFPLIPNRATTTAGSLLQHHFHPTTNSTRALTYHLLFSHHSKYQPPQLHSYMLHVPLCFNLPISSPTDCRYSTNSAKGTTSG
eukprot:gene6132-4412_t